MSEKVPVFTLNTLDVLQSNPPKDTTVMELKEAASEPTPQKTMEILYERIEEVKDEMKKNVKQVLDRNENLDTLTKTSDDLKTWAENFDKKTGKVVRSYCWKRARLITVIVGVVFVIIIVIIVILLATGVIPTHIRPPPAPPTSKP